MRHDPKETNPKDSVGVRKVPFSVIPTGVIAKLGLALLEGARKYGRHNWRDGSAKASTYYDGVQRHLVEWWEGQDVDSGSSLGLHNVDKAIAGLFVLRDAMLCGRFVDDRPPAMYPTDWVAQANEAAGKIIDKLPEAKAPHVQQGRGSTAALAEADYVSGVKDRNGVASSDTRTPCQSCHLADDNPVFEGIGRCHGCPKRLDVV